MIFLERLRICPACKSQIEALPGPFCPACGIHANDTIRRNLKDYDKGLDSGTRLTDRVTIERESHGLFAVVDVATKEKKMCGFDTQQQAFLWCLLRGLLPVRSDAETQRTWNQHS